MPVRGGLWIGGPMTLRKTFMFGFEGDYIQAAVFAGVNARSLQMVETCGGHKYALLHLLEGKTVEEIRACVAGIRHDGVIGFSKDIYSMHKHEIYKHIVTEWIRKLDGVPSTYVEHMFIAKRLKPPPALRWLRRPKPASGRRQRERINTFIETLAQARQPTAAAGMSDTESDSADEMPLANDGAGANEMPLANDSAGGMPGGQADTESDDDDVPLANYSAGANEMPLAHDSAGGIPGGQADTESADEMPPANDSPDGMPGGQADTESASEMPLANDSAGGMPGGEADTESDDDDVPLAPRAKDTGEEDDEALPRPRRRVFEASPSPEVEPAPHCGATAKLIFSLERELKHAYATIADLRADLTRERAFHLGAFTAYMPHAARKRR